MTQMDLLDLLVAPEPRPEDLDRDTDVLGCYLAPWQLHRIVRVLDDPSRLKWVRADMVSGHFGGAGRDYRWNTETDGLHITRWYDEPVPWVIGWPAVFRIIRERTTPERAEALHLAKTANGTTLTSAAEYAAAHAILPNRWHPRRAELAAQMEPLL